MSLSCRIRGDLAEHGLPIAVVKCVILLSSKNRLNSSRQPRAGVDQGPIHLVEAGLIEQLSGLGWQVKFDGHHQFEDINAVADPPIGKLKNPRLVSRVCESVAKVVGEHVKAGELPVTLGGDHSLVRVLLASEAH